MDNLKFQHIVQGWISTLFGLALMVLAFLYIFFNIKTITFEQVIIGAAIGVVGFIFLFVKDDLITRFFSKKVLNEEENIK